MANLTQNLELLRLGKQNLIDKINTKLIDSDKEILSIDCEWDDVINLLSKIRVKRDHSAEIDTNAIYTDLCEGTFNTEVVTAVTSIMSYAMYGQTYLPKITGENVTSIGDYAFHNCSNLTSALFPKTTSVGNYAFYGCSKLEDTDFSKLVTVQQYAFSNCGFTTISLPKVTTYNSYSFTNCKNLKTITLNLENQYSINTGTFDGCESLETDVTVNASTIGNSSIRNTKIISMESDTVTSIGQNGIENNQELEQINFPNLTYINYRAISTNPKLQSVLLPKLTTISGTFYNNPLLSMVYMPNVTKIGRHSGWLFEECSSISAISFPNAETELGYTDWSDYTNGIAYKCDNLLTIDLSSITKIGSYGQSWKISTLPKLQTINMSNLKYCYPSDTGSYYTNYNGGDSNYFWLLNRIGCTSISLPSLKFINVYTGSKIVQNAYELTKLELPQLTKINNYQLGTNSYSNLIVAGCPKLKEIELPNLEFIHGYQIFGSTQDGINQYGTACEHRYCENYIEYLKYRYPTNYQNRTDYCSYYERLNGGLAVAGDFTTASPWNNGIQSNYLYNMAWCGLETINLPKLSNWSSCKYLCYYTNDLITLVLGDGSFTPTTTSLPSNFVVEAWELRRVVLNYPIVLTASTALTGIFVDCPHLNGARYETTNYNGQHWYHANPEQLQDLYFYVPDNLVDSYKAATNWSTYANQIRPISELSDAVIDSSITEIEDEAYKNNQELNTIAGYGITTIGTKAFYNSSVTIAEFPLAENISSYAFAECQNLAKVILAFSKITTIAEGAFKNTAITEANYPNVITINKQAFYGCQDLSSISIPKCEIIYDDAFNSANLAVLNASELKTIGNNVFKNNSLESLTLPKIVTIGNNAFEDNVLTSLSLDTLTTIGNEAFKNNNLTSISFANLTSIGTNAFEDNNITSVSIPKIAVIKDNAFKDNANLASINLASVVALGSNVFNGCSSLTDITFEGYIVPTVGENTIKSTYILHVRPEMIDDFQEAFPNNTIVGDVS